MVTQQTLSLVGFALVLLVGCIDGRNITDFVNATHVFVGEDVHLLTPDVDAQRLIALTFRERAPLAIMYPFVAFAESQARRTFVNGQDGIFQICGKDDQVEAPCLRPGAVYVPLDVSDGEPLNETLHVGMPPFVPSDVAAEVLNSSAVTITWSTADPGIIDHYECYIYWNDRYGARADAPLADPRLLDILTKSITNITSPLTISGLPPFSWLRIDFVAVHKLNTYGYRSLFTSTKAASLASQKPLLLVVPDNDRNPTPTFMSVVSFAPEQYPDILTIGEAEVTSTVTNETFFRRIELIVAGFQGQTIFGGRVDNLQPFTAYVFRFRILGDLTKTATQYSDPVVARTPAGVQPAMVFEESKENTDPQQFVNITWVPQPNYDANLTIRLRTINIEGEIVDVIDCTTCTYWLFSAPDVRAGRIRFVAGQAINSIGNSSSSGLFRLQSQAPVSSGNDNSTAITIALATVLPIVLALAIMTAVLYRRWRTRYVYQVLKFPAPDEWEIPRDKVVVDFRNELGHGAFGIVFGGHLLVDVDDDLAAGAPVAIKTLRNEASDERKMELIEEAGRMKRLGRHTHPNVIQLYGVCLQAQPLLVIMEYAPHGTLRAYASENSLSTGQQVRAVLDVARGMAYLAEHDFVHRDLAARNCMVGAGYVVKVADFGLARDIHYLHYYRKTGSAVLPVRWMAPECMVEGKFDAETDVWSYGVVVWEVFSQGRLPYEEMTNDQVYEAVIRGLRLQPPKDMPPFMGEVLKSCFALQRPSFASLAHVLQRYCIDNNYQAVGESGDCGGNFSTRATPQPRGGTPPSAKGFDESVV